jgi:hypothetical protein
MHLLHTSTFSIQTVQVSLLQCAAFCINGSQHSLLCITVCKLFTNQLFVSKCVNHLTDVEYFLYQCLNVPAICTNWELSVLMCKLPFQCVSYLYPQIPPISIPMCNLAVPMSHQSISIVPVFFYIL